MISESPFSAVFGAAVPGGDDSLVHLARAAVNAGFAVVPNHPGTKKPMCTLNALERKRADVAAQEEARLAGHRNPDNARHICGVHHAITLSKDSDRVIRRLIKDGQRPNLGIELGRSNVIVIDVDTLAELEGFKASWAEASPDVPLMPMTVASPGVQSTVDGEWKHKGGGHYWFSLPEDWRGRFPHADGAMKDPSGWIAMWADRQVLVPPSVRKEGAYQLVGDMHPAPKWLLQRILGYVIERQARTTEQRARQAERMATGGVPAVDVWSAITPWDDILEPDGWTKTGLVETCSCPTWTAPGIHASPKSAVAHEVGCSGSMIDVSLGHGPLHVWTDNPPDFLMQFGKTFTKLNYIAYRDHGGVGPQSIALVSRALGLSREGGATAELIPLPGVPAHLGGPLPSTSTAGQAPLPPLAAPALPLGPGLAPPDPTSAGTGGDQAPAADYAIPAPVEPLSLFERAVREQFQNLIIRAEADRRHTEHRFPYAAKASSRVFRPMAEVMREVSEHPAEFLVERWLRKGSYGVMGAQYKAGKTFLVIDMALSVITGGLFLGIIPCAQGNVAIMHNEGDLNEFTERLLAAARAKGIVLTDEILARLTIQEGATKLDQPEAVARLYDNLVDFSPDLLIIDPWYMSAGDDADGKTLSKMGTVLGNLQGVAAELKSALLVTAHWNKSGDGKGVARWSGSGLAEWGRVLINVSVSKFFSAAPYIADKTGRTKVDLIIDLSGQVSGNYWVHREVWRDDAKDLRSPMHYEVTAREQEDIESDGLTAAFDTTRTPRERLLRAFGAIVEGMSKTKAIETAKGPKGGRALSVWREAFDELLRAGFVEEVGVLEITDSEGRLKVNPGSKFAITAAGRGEIQRFDESHKSGGRDTSRFVPLAGSETAQKSAENDSETGL